MIMALGYLKQERLVINSCKQRGRLNATRKMIKLVHVVLGISEFCGFHYKPEIDKCHSPR